MLLRRGCLALVIGLSACGSQTADTPRTEIVQDAAHGITVQLPRGWQRATASLTPHLTDPREVLSVGTFPLRYREGRCANVPGSALEDLGPADAFITLEERGLDPGSDWADFPPRPAHFGPQGTDTNADAQPCSPGAHFTNYWFGFTDAGRHFHVLVAFGPGVTDARRSEAWQVLDSLKIDPRVEPDWHSSG